MTDSTSLLGLIKRLEENDAPDRVLDADIAEALGGGRRYGNEGWLLPLELTPNPGDGQWAARYTEYLGAVRRAMPEATRWRITANQKNGRCQAHVFYSETEYAEGVAASECNALCIAYLWSLIKKAETARRTDRR